VVVKFPLGWNVDEWGIWRSLFAYQRGKLPLTGLFGFFRIEVRVSREIYIVEYVKKVREAFLF
jgi:hypothetical protein